MKVLVFVLLIGACCTVLADSTEDDQLAELASKLPEDKKKIVANIATSLSKLSEKESIKLYKPVIVKDPELSRILKLAIEKEANSKDISESKRQFLKFYYSRVSKMPDTSDKSFDELIKEVKAKYLELDHDTQYDLRESEHKIVDLIGMQTEYEKQFHSLPEERQKAYDDFFEGAKTGEQITRAEVRMHLKDPELFKILLLKFKDNEVDFGEGSKEALEFLKFFYGSIADIKDDSDEELKKHRTDVLDKWNKLDAKTQKEALEYEEDLKPFIENYG
ncbi:hypothetical protein M3Y97_01138200 [Aphelenchoides bicaudatus]|nr:hypothetical protein M3Y97_01138200 [Aphelenchoides bicaudatus]